MLGEALRICERLGIGAFRVGSGMWPLYTHPESGYAINDLPTGAEVIREMSEAGEFARERAIRLSFHPDQFTLLSSPREEVVEAARRDLIYMNEMSELIGADVINIHGGGVYGDKPSAVVRLIRNIEVLPSEVRGRLTLENDDVSYTPADLLPVCQATGVPLVYDVHHHRCLPDGLSTEEATGRALTTWNREPLFHISSSRDPAGANLRPHAEYIRPEDFPRFWCTLPMTVDVEAKAKESALLRLAGELGTGTARVGTYQS
jgi:UV DNA damage endonuclease